MDPLQNHSFTASMLSSTRLETPPVVPVQKSRVGLLLGVGAVVALGAVAYVGTRADKRKIGAETDEEPSWKQAVREVVREEIRGR